MVRESVGTHTVVCLVGTMSNSCHVQSVRTAALAAQLLHANPPPYTTAAHRTAPTTAVVGGAALTALDPINPLITLIPLLNVFSIPFTITCHYRQHFLTRSLLSHLSGRQGSRLSYTCNIASFYSTEHFNPPAPRHHLLE